MGAKQGLTDLELMTYCHHVHESGHDIAIFSADLGNDGSAVNVGGSGGSYSQHLIPATGFKEAFLCFSGWAAVQAVDPSLVNVGKAYMSARDDEGSDFVRTFKALNETRDRMRADLFHRKQTGKEYSANLLSVLMFPPNIRTVERGVKQLAEDFFSLPAVRSTVHELQVRRGGEGNSHRRALSGAEVKEICGKRLGHLDNGWRVTPEMKALATMAYCRAGVRALGFNGDFKLNKAGEPNPGVDSGGPNPGAAEYAKQAAYGVASAREHPQLHPDEAKKDDHRFVLGTAHTRLKAVADSLIRSPATSSHEAKLNEANQRILEVQSDSQLHPSANVWLDDSRKDIEKCLKACSQPIINAM